MLRIILLMILLFHCLTTVGLAQNREIAELKALRSEFVKATNEYKASLAKLIPFQEAKVKRAEAKLEMSKRLRAEGLVGQTQVEENERAVGAAKEQVTETQRQMADADKQIASLPTDEELIKEYRRARLSRKRSPRRCANWDLVASQRQTANSISFSYKFVCR